VQLAVLEETESYVQERDGEIRNIVKSIEELSTIFKELAVLVIDQVSSLVVVRTCCNDALQMMCSM
jgi:t-SNARE complex subunit (syntaxin)